MAGPTAYRDRGSHPRTAVVGEGRQISNGPNWFGRYIIQYTDTSVRCSVNIKKVNVK